MAGVPWMSFGAVAARLWNCSCCKCSNSWSPDVLQGPGHARDGRGAFPRDLNVINREFIVIVIKGNLWYLPALQISWRGRQICGIIQELDGVVERYICYGPNYAHKN